MLARIVLDRGGCSPLSGGQQRPQSGDALRSSSHQLGLDPYETDSVGATCSFAAARIPIMICLSFFPRTTTWSAAVSRASTRID